MADASASSSDKTPLESMKSMSGLDFLTAIREGRLPGPPIAKLMGLRLTEVAHGRAVFEGIPTPDHYNPIGSVHGGYAATLLDSCMGCAVHSALPRGTGYTTLEFKVSLVRAITSETGCVRAEGSILTVGRRVGTAEGRLVDAAGKLLAHATTTCLILAL